MRQGIIVFFCLCMRLMRIKIFTCASMRMDPHMRIIRMIRNRMAKPSLYSLLTVINVTRSFPKNCCPCFCLLSYLSAFNCILMKFRHVTKTAWFQSSIAATHRLPPLNHKTAEVLSQELIWDLFPPSFRSSFTITFDICWFNILQVIRTGSFHQEKQQDQPSPN